MMCPIDPIGDIQSAIIARLTAAFMGSDGRSALKQVAQIDVPFDGATDRNFQISPPAIYLTPLVINRGQTQGSLKIRWAAYCLASAASIPARTKGSSVAFGLGAWAIATRAALVLDEWAPDVEGASMLELGGIENLTGMTMRDKNLHVWAITLDGEICTSLQNEIDAGINGDDLDDFLVFHADFDIQRREDPPESLPAELDASLRVELPQ